MYLGVLWESMIVKQTCELSCNLSKRLLLYLNWDFSFAYRNNDFVFCTSADGGFDCGISNEHIAASISSSLKNIFVNYVTYKYISDVFVASGTYKESAATMGSSLLAVATHSGTKPVPDAKVQLTFSLIEVCAFHQFFDIHHAVSKQFAFGFSLSNISLTLAPQILSV